MVRGLGVLTAVTLAALALLHIFWASGGKWGRGAAVPTSGGSRLFNPSPTGTAAVAAALLSATYILLGQLGWWGSPLPRWVFYWGTWGISLTFLARAVGEFKYLGFFKQVRDTDFALWDSWLFSPLCLLIAVSSGVVASVVRL